MSAPARTTHAAADAGRPAAQDAAASPESTVPDDPTDLSRDDYRTVLKSTVAEIKRDDVPSMAAGVAFKIFLSLFPAILAAGAVFALVTSAEDFERLLAQAQGLLPGAALELIQQPLQELTEGGGAVAGSVLVGGLLGGLWAATSAAVTLMKALSRAYNVPESRKFVRQRLVALVLTVALFLTLVGLALLLVAGPQITGALLPARLDGTGIGWLVGAARWLAAVVLLIVLFAFVYWVGPDREQPSWAWISPGAIAAVVGWLLVSAGFTLYVQLAGTYEADYGAVLGGVIVLLLWLQLSMLMLLAGAELNSETERARSRAAAVTAGAGFGSAGEAHLASAVAGGPAGASLAAELAGLALPVRETGASPSAVSAPGTSGHPPPEGQPLPGLEETETPRVHRLQRSLAGNGGRAGLGAAAATAAALLAVARLARARR